MKSFIVLVLLVLGIGVIGAVSGKVPLPKTMDSIIPSQSASSSSSEKESAQKVDASELVADYQANELSADQKYKGKACTITGTVEKISKDCFGRRICGWI